MSLPTDQFNIPGTQKAWRIHTRGTPAHALVLDENLPVPIPSKGEVLVKVQAAALNPTGYKLMKQLPNFLASRPYVAEHDIAGIVVNANGTHLRKGDEVFGCILGGRQRKTKQGALAQYVTIPAEHVVIRPPNITPTQAAGVSLVALTAHQALFEIAKLEPGQSLFVNGGSTAVGASAIQLAKDIGCKVTVTASGRNEEFVKSLGADVFIDYTKESPYKVLENDPPTPKFHVVLEAVGNVDLPLYAHSEAYLAPGGIFVSVGPQPSSFGEVPSLVRYIWGALLHPAWLGGTKRKWSVVFVKSRQEDLQHIADLISNGKFKPVVDSVFSFEDTLKAYDRIMTKRATGKVVIKVEPEVD